MDKEVLNNKVQSLLDLIDKLKEVLEEHKKNISLQEFLLYAAEKKAEEIVELATSINQELLRSKDKFGLSYYDSFIELKIFNVFTEDELKNLANTAGFRNRLSHDYLDVDAEVALKTMKRMIKQYAVYSQKVRKILS